MHTTLKIPLLISLSLLSACTTAVLNPPLLKWQFQDICKAETNINEKINIESFLFEETNFGKKDTYILSRVIDLENLGADSAKMIEFDNDQSIRSTYLNSSRITNSTIDEIYKNSPYAQLWKINNEKCNKESIIDLISLKSKHSRSDCLKITFSTSRLTNNTVATSTYDIASNGWSNIRRSETIVNGEITVKRKTFYYEKSKTILDGYGYVENCPRK